MCALAIITDANYATDLPVFIPDPVNGLPSFRWAAGNVAAGAVASWASDLGAATPLLGSGTAQPTRTTDGGGLPVVDFDGVNDKVAATGLAYTQLTAYMVFSLDVAASKGLLSCNGAALQTDAASKLKLLGSPGSITTVGALAAGTKYALALAVDTTADTAAMDYLAERITGTPTFGVFDRFTLGSDGTGFQDGKIYEFIAYTGVIHNQAQRDAQMKALRDWYGAL